MNNIFNEFFATNTEEEIYNLSSHYERIYYNVDIIFKYVQALKLLFHPL